MSYKFDGTEDRLYPNYGSVEGKLAADYNFPVTIAFWYKAPDVQAFQFLVHWATTNSTDVNSIRLITDTGGGNDYAAGTYLTGGVSAWSVLSRADSTYDNTWIPVVMVFDGTGTTCTSRRVFIGTYSNASTAETTSSDLGAALAYLKVGAKFHDNGSGLGAANPNEHRLAELALWDVALSQANIESYLAASPASGIDASNLIAYWALQSGLSKTAGTDAVGALVAGGNATLDSSDNPTITSATKYVKVLAVADAASETAVEGVVLNAARDTVIGEFTGQAFEASLESGEAVLLIAATDITPDGSTLTTSDTPIVFAYNATDSLIGPASATVIEV